MARRALSELAEQLAYRVFGVTLPYGKVRLSDRVAWGGRPFTVPTGGGRRSHYVIQLGPQGFASALSTPGLQAILIHELTHVWQGHTHCFCGGMW